MIPPEIVKNANWFTWCIFILFGICRLNSTADPGLPFFLLFSWLQLMWLDNLTTSLITIFLLIRDQVDNSNENIEAILGIERLRRLLSPDLDVEKGSEPRDFR